MTVNWRVSFSNFDFTSVKSKIDKFLISHDDITIFALENSTPKQFQYNNILVVTAQILERRKRIVHHKEDNAAQVFVVLNIKVKLYIIRIEIGYWETDILRSLYKESRLCSSKRFQHFNHFHKFAIHIIFAMLFFGSV